MFKNDYNRYKSLVEEQLVKKLPKVHENSKILQESMEYSLLAGGKRLRPVMLLAACNLAGGNMEEAMDFAVAIEYIHTYSLIHDDLPAMDNDDYRRGKLTNHKVYGDAVAVLAGDGLLNSAFDIMTESMLRNYEDLDSLQRKLKATHVIAKAAGTRGMIAGQIADMESEKEENKSNIDIEFLNYIQMNKTGALFAGAIMAGLYMANAGEELIEDMLEYAKNMGAAFQVADDILDVKGSLESLGKAVGKDQDKATYITLCGLEESERTLHDLTQKAIEPLAKYGDKTAFFRELVLYLEHRTY